MNQYLTFQQLTYLQELIQKKRTGSPKELAVKLNISERTVYRKIKALEEITLEEIIFCVHSNSYCFKGKYNTD